MKIVVMGTGPFAVPMFRALVDSDEHDVLCLITRPSRQGKSRQAAVNPMRGAAEPYDLTVHAPEDINSEEGQSLLREYAPDLLVVCDYGQILAAETLKLARLGGVNLHGSLLPRYRGAAPVQWALLSGDTETGVTVIHMTPRLDAGPCLVQLEEAIRDDDNGLSLEVRLSEQGVSAVLGSIEMLGTWNGDDVIGVVQDKSQATKAPRLKKSDGRIDWQRTAPEIERQLRAFTPWPGTFTFIPRRKGDPQRLIVLEASVSGDSTDAAPGEVLVAEGNQLHVAAGGGSVLAIQQVQPAGKRAMQVDEYLRGRPVAVGDVL